MNYALIVGIDKYLTPGNDLAGCVNDAHDIAKLLSLDIFEYTDITMLLDESATTQNITDKLTSLVDNLQPGDNLLYYHSGHGTQIADTSGDEFDNLDEVLVSHDTGTGANYTDDVLKQCLSNHPEGANIAIIIDTCHSGGTNFVTGERAFGTDNQTPKLYKSVEKSGAARVNRFGVRSTSSGTQRHILLASSREEQLSFERKIKGKTRGVFTHQFCKMVRKRKNMFWKGVWRIRNNIHRSSGGKQTPYYVIPEEYRETKILRQ